MMQKHILSALLLTILFSKLTYGWWDNIHMMIGKIAESHLTKPEIEKINSYLGLWEHNYPGMSDMITACTFPDHIRCKEPIAECQGLPFQDYFEVFKNSHVSYIPYNPLNLDEELILKPRPGAQEGIAPLVNSIKNHVNYLKENPCTVESCENQVGSDFSWNFFLRLFLHMYADLHVPCHCCYGINHFYPLGDNMGKLVFLGWPQAVFKGTHRQEFDNLHRYIDSVGHQYYKMWPEMTIQEAGQMAKDFMNKFPIETLDTLYDFDPWDIDKITMESHNLGVYIYDLIGFTEFNPNKGKIFLSEQIHKEIQFLLEKRTVIAGHRLGKAIGDYIKALPDLDAQFHSKLCTKP